MTDERNILNLPVIGQDDSCRGWVRLDEDRVGHSNQTEFCITIDTSAYLSPFEARAFADRLIQASEVAEVSLERAKRSIT